MAVAEKKRVIKNILKKLPLKNIMIFESNPDFCDNTYWFYRYIAPKVCKKYKFVWVIKNEQRKTKRLDGFKIKCVPERPQGLVQRLIRAYYLNRAAFIFDSNSYIHKRDTRQCRVFLGHGMPLKMVYGYGRYTGEADLFTVSSDFFITPYSKLRNCPESRVVSLGCPRDDVFADKTLTLDKILPQFREKKAVIWMPTYRQHKNGESNCCCENQLPLGLPLVKSREQIEKLNKFLAEKNSVLFIRPHPVQDMGVFLVEDFSNIIIADEDFLVDNKIQLFELMAVSQAMITDYSSLYYDFLLTDRPIALTVDDIDVFKRRWNFWFDDMESNIVGQRLKDVEDLYDFLEAALQNKDPFAQKRAEARKRFHRFSDGKSAQRIYDYLVDNYNL